MAKNTNKKLVRDFIPKIVESSNQNLTFYTAHADEYLALLRSKLSEEVEEFLSSNSLEELADILEVIDALCGALGYSHDQLKNIKNDKQKTRGGFQNKVVLLKK